MHLMCARFFFLDIFSSFGRFSSSPFFTLLNLTVRSELIKCIVKLVRIRKNIINNIKWNEWEKKKSNREREREVDDSDFSLLLFLIFEMKINKENCKTILILTAKQSLFKTIHIHLNTQWYKYICPYTIIWLLYTGQSFYIQYIFFKCVYIF